MNITFLLAMLNRVSTDFYKKTRIFSITTLVLILTSNIAGAQQISSCVIGAAGGSILTTSMLLDWTLGESFTETISDNATQLTEGFQQPNLCVETITEIAFLATDRSEKIQENLSTIYFWPNPTGEVLSARINSDQYATATVQLINENGQFLQQSTQSTNTDFQISMRNFQNGQYFIRISDSNGQLIGAKKITLSK